MKKEFYLVNITNPVVPIAPERYGFMHLNRTLSQNNLPETRKKKDITFLLGIQKIFAAYVKILKYISNNQEKKYLILTQPPLLHYFILTLFPAVAKRSTLLLMDLYPQLLVHEIEKHVTIKNLCSQIFLKPIFSFDKIVFIADGPSFRFALKNSKKQNVFLARNLTSLPPLKSTVTKKLNSVRVLYQGSFNKTADLKYMNILEQVFEDEGVIFTSHVKKRFLKSHISGQTNVSDKELVDIMKINNFGLIVLKKTISDYTNPSKFVSYLSQGLPVLYFGPEDNEIYHLITEENCGIVLPDDKLDLKRMFQSQVFDDTSLYSKQQKNSLRVYNKYYCDLVLTKIWHQILKNKP